MRSRIIFVIGQTPMGVDNDRFFIGTGGGGGGGDRVGRVGRVANVVEISLLTQIKTRCGRDVAMRVLDDRQVC